jgi:hypothetical protein
MISLKNELAVIVCRNPAGRNISCGWNGISSWKRIK